MPHSVKGLRSEHSASSWSSARRRYSSCHLALCICCNQSAVTMRLGTGLTSAKLTPFFRSSTAGWTADSEYLFGAEFSLHDKKITPDRLRGWSILNSFGNYWIIVWALVSSRETMADWADAGETSSSRRPSRARFPDPPKR